VCFCEDKDTNHVFLRGKCIFCLFDGSKKFEDEWDSLCEVLDGIALRTYKLGLAQGKGRSPLFPMSKEVKKLKKAWNELFPLYALYKAGHEAGMNISRIPPAAEPVMNCFPCNLTKVPPTL
jgi:hypothetical protein